MVFLLKRADVITKIKLRGTEEDNKITAAKNINYDFGFGFRFFDLRLWIYSNFRF